MRGVQKAINDFDMSWVKSREGDASIVNCKRRERRT